MQGMFQDIKRDTQGNVPGHKEIQQEMFKDIKRHSRECSGTYRGEKRRQVKITKNSNSESSKRTPS